MTRDRNRLRRYKLIEMMRAHALTSTDAGMLMQRSASNVRKYRSGAMAVPEAALRLLELELHHQGCGV